MLNWVLLRTTWPRVGGTSGTSGGKKSQKKSKDAKPRLLSVAPVREGFVLGHHTEALLKKSIEIERKKKEKTPRTQWWISMSWEGSCWLGEEERGVGGWTRGCLGAVWRVTPHPSCCCPECKPWRPGQAALAPWRYPASPSQNPHSGTSGWWTLGREQRQVPHHTSEPVWPVGMSCELTGQWLVRISLTFYS